MTNEKHPNRLLKVMATVAVALGLAAGSYGIAGAATGSSSSTSSTSTSTAATTPSTTPSAGPSNAPDPSRPWGGQRSDETLLTGDTLAKVTAAAVAKVPGATIVRVETDADGHAAYEAHMVKSDGTPVTVYVDKQFDVVSVETR